MVRSKFLVRLFALLSVTMIVALAFGVFAMTGGTSAHASPAASSNGAPRFAQFHHTFASTDLAKAGLVSWSSTFKSEGKTWKYTMVGTNPASGSKTTTTANTIVPLIIKFSNGKSFDGTHVVAQTTSSPLYKNAPFISGTTQYTDAIQRGEFWSIVKSKSPNYHVLLGTPTIAKAVTMTIPASSGATAKDPSTGKTIGLININYFDPQIQSMLVSMHFKPNMLPIFLTYDVYLTAGAPILNNCCIGGYHNAVTNQNGLQTYAVSAEVDKGVQGGFSEDVSALTHELAEWTNDPFTNNVVPNWISPIAPQYGCNNSLEVGDPLVGVLFTVKGFSSSHLQDEAFFSWFARQSPSIGINGLYTYLGTFKGLSKMC